MLYTENKVGGYRGYYMKIEDDDKKLICKKHNLDDDEMYLTYLLGFYNRIGKDVQLDKVKNIFLKKLNKLLEKEGYFDGICLDIFPKTHFYYLDKSSLLYPCPKNIDLIEMSRQYNTASGKGGIPNGLNEIIIDFYTLEAINSKYRSYLFPRCQINYYTDVYEGDDKFNLFNHLSDDFKNTYDIIHTSEIKNFTKQFKEYFNISGKECVKRETLYFPINLYTLNELAKLIYNDWITNTVRRETYFNLSTSKVLRGMFV